MTSMNLTDECAVDARLLQMMLAVLETGSVTAAAQRLDMTQSAVSHGLDRLRAHTGDPLFVKAGRGIVPTARAGQLAAPARELVQALHRFGRREDFDPSAWRATVTVAANDFQRDLLLPALAARLRSRAPGVALRILPSGVPTLDLLRSDDCQLVISPRPPTGSDIVQTRLFVDGYRVFYDPRVRTAPQGLREYLQADHATVVYEGQRSALELDELLQARGLCRRFAVQVPGFSALPAFLRGSHLLVTAPGLLARSSLAGFANCDPPTSCPDLPMYALWHARCQQDPAHRWLREQLGATLRGGRAHPPQAAA